MKTQHGFGAIAIIGIIVVIGIIGLSGWLVWQKSSSNAGVTANPKIEAITTPSPATVKNEDSKYVLVIQDDNSIKAVTPAEIAKTDDQKNILAALHTSCTSSNASYVLVNNIVFGENNNYFIDGNYATINATACTVLAQSVSEIEGSGGRYFLHKAATGAWIKDGGTQMSIPSCSEIDDKGYPKTIFETCYDEDQNLRAPK